MNKSRAMCSIKENKKQQLSLYSNDEAKTSSIDSSSTQVTGKATAKRTAQALK
jgi:hypothetical protein